MNSQKNNSIKIVKQRFPLFEKKDPIHLSLIELFNLAMWGFGLFGESYNEQEIVENLNSIKQDQLAYEYYHLLVNAASHYAISKDGKVTQIYTDDNEDFQLYAITEIAQQVPLNVETIKALYKGEGSVRDWIDLFVWYKRQLPGFQFDNFYDDNALVIHVYLLSQIDRVQLTINRDMLYSKLTVQ